MGIEPWIQKQSQVRLVVLLNELIYEKQKRFLKHIVDYLGLEESNVFLLNSIENSYSTLPSKAKSAKVTLNLGLKEPILDTLSMGIKLFTCSNIAYYLNNPLAKKELLKELNDVKSYLIV